MQALPRLADSSCVFFSGKAQCLPEKDLLTLEVVAGSKVTPVFVSLSIGKSTAGGWQRVAADLSPFAGKKVQLRWRFATGSGAKNGFEGVWLDDIVVETVCPGAVCTASSDCGGDSNTCTLDTCSLYSNSESGGGACLYGVAPDCCRKQRRLWRRQRLYNRHLHGRCLQQCAGRQPASVLHARWPGGGLL